MSYIISPLLLPHLLDGVSQVESADFLIILELEKLIATMSRHINKDVGTIVGK